MHLDLQLNEDRKKLPEYRRFADFPFEVQLRTIAQDAWSTIDHKIKYKKNIPLDLKRRINRLAALFELADQEFINIRDYTSKLEKMAGESKQGITDNSSDSKRLDVFGFLSIVKELWPGYTFSPENNDGFVDEILSVHPTFLFSTFKDIVLRCQETINAYREYRTNYHHRNLNPYTMIRHMLYLSDKEKFAIILFDRQRESFEDWIENLRPVEHKETALP